MSSTDTHTGEIAGSYPATVAWLLAGDDPSVRFFTFVDLLGASPTSSAAIAARREIMAGGIVPTILAAQDDDGHWQGRERFYRAKYSGTVWQLIVLAELGADGSDERLRRGCEADLARRSTPRLGRILHQPLQEGRRGLAQRGDPVSHRQHGVEPHPPGHAR